MTGVQITIDDAEVNAMLARVEKAGADTQPLMAEIAGAMLVSTQRRFETALDRPRRHPWQRLNPRTAARRVNRKGTRRGFDNILRVSNRLYDSIVGEASATEAAVGSNVTYAAAHQLGAEIEKPERQATVQLRKVKGRTRFASKTHKRKREMDVTIGAHTITIPARPYLGFSKEDREEIAAISPASIEHFEAAAGKALS